MIFVSLSGCLQYSWKSRPQKLLPRSRLLGPIRQRENQHAYSELLMSYESKRTSQRIVCRHWAFGFCTYRSLSMDPSHSNSLFQEENQTCLSCISRVQICVQNSFDHLHTSSYSSNMLSVDGDTRPSQQNHVRLSTARLSSVHS